MVLALCNSVILADTRSYKTVYEHSLIDVTLHGWLFEYTGHTKNQYQAVDVDVLPFYLTLI